MRVPEKYMVKPVHRYECKDWIVKKHYAKRLPPIEYAYGLFNIENILIGVVTYGTPVSHTLRSLFNGYKLIELNRLVVSENLDKNCLSYFVSQSIKLLPKPLVIVSYADTSMNHHGYIYQATNWHYTGLSIPFKDYYVKGKEHLHNGTIMDMSRGKENRVDWLRETFGDDLIMIERAQKHRYFYFNGSKKDKKIMFNLLKYDVLPYPKGDNIRYDASYKPTTNGNLF